MDLLNWSEVLKSLIFWGPGAFIAGLIIVAIYKFASNIGAKFIGAQVAQAEALGKQAQSMEGLKNSIASFVLKDNSEHRDMLVLLRYIAQKQQSLEEVKIEHYNRKKQTHQNCPVESA